MRSFNDWSKENVVTARVLPEPPEQPAPSFRKFTDAVQRGLKQMLVSAKLDARTELVRADGSIIDTRVDDLRAAITWLEYVLASKAKQKAEDTDERSDVV